MLTPVVVRTLRGPIELADVLPSGPTGEPAEKDARAVLPADVLPSAPTGEPAKKDAGAVLVVHGLPGDWRQARGLVADLPGQRVLLVSRPGYGRTPIASGRTPAEQADLYAAMLDELGIGEVVVLGISGGGPSSYAFAARHPERCAGLVLACPLDTALTATPAAMRRLAAVPGLWTALNGMVRLAARLRPRGEPGDRGLTELERSLAQDPRTREALRTFHLEQPSTMRGKGMRNDVQQLGREVDGLVTTPTIVLHGDLDDVVPLSHGEQYASVIPGSELVVLAGLGHSVPLFAREDVLSAVRKLSGTPAQTCAGPGQVGSGDSAGGATSVS